MPKIEHKPKAPKKHTGVRQELRYVDCSCGWEGRLTLPEDAAAEQAVHASGEVMDWEAVR